MNALEFASRNWQITRLLCAAANDDSVKIFHQLLWRDCLAGIVFYFRAHCLFANINAGSKGNPLGLHLLNAAINQPLFHFEVRNTIAQQAANPIILLIYGDIVAGARQLLCRRHTSRA